MYFHIHTFMLMALNAHLPLWTFLSSKHRINPFSSSNCDSGIWAVQDSHLSSQTSEEPGRPQKRGDMSTPIHHSCRNWTADMIYLPAVTLGLRSVTVTVGFVRFVRPFFTTLLLSTKKYKKTSSPSWRAEEWQVWPNRAQDCLQPRFSNLLLKGANLICI